MSQKTVYVADDVEAAIEELAEERNIDESVAMRRAMERGLEQYGYLNRSGVIEWSISTLGYALLLAALSLLVATAPTSVNILPTGLSLAALGGVLVLVVRVLPTLRSWSDGVLGRGEPS